MALLNSFISWVMQKRMHQIELFLKYPHEVQKEWFNRLIGAARDTDWGRKYDYQSIQSVETFKERVPVSEYQDLQPYIQKILEGEQSVLWPSEIKWFAKSSGTTAGKSKFIPVSAESLEECHFKGGKDMLSFYCINFPDTRVFEGKGLGLGGTHSISEINNEEYYVGDLSAILIQNLPFWAEFMRTPNLSIALMGEWEEKIEKMARATIQHSVTNLSGVPSWTLLLMRRILEITGKDSIMDVWPGLEVYYHGGVDFGPYRQQFRDVMGKDINYVQNYNASEGFFGIQDRKVADDMLLMLDYGVYYEFMPLDELGNDHPRTKALHEVEIGENYALVINTNAGLWRYLIGDTVQFTSLNPYRIKITGRTKNFINAFGEELIIENAERAIELACSKAGALVGEYTVSPVFLSGNEKACHQWLIEFEKKPDNINFFTEVLDNALKSLNSDYEAKRYNDLLLDKPELISIPQGTFYRWMKSRGKLGGQHKVPRLFNNRTYADEILGLIKNDN